MIDSGDVIRLVAELPASARTVNVIPGLQMLFSWPLARATEIDRRNGMVEELTRIANEGLLACGGEPFVVPQEAERELSRRQTTG
jgi:hypothetical protein